MLECTTQARVSACCSSGPRIVTGLGDRNRHTPAADPPLDNGQLLGLNGRSRWRVHDHPRMEKSGCDEPPLSVGSGENHTPLGKGGYVRNGSEADLRWSPSYDNLPARRQSAIIGRFEHI